jgi:hypothetical protein
MRYINSGTASYGQFYTEMKGLILKRDRSIALHSVLGHVEDGINYEQRRAAVNQAMYNINRDMQKHCIGCAFSRENKEETSRNGASDSWSGVSQGHEINGTNKICKYMKDGSPKYITVASYEVCPVLGESNTPENNGVFTGSYLQGLNKACVYNQFGSKKIVTVGLTDSCPQ